MGRAVIFRTGSRQLSRFYEGSLLIMAFVVCALISTILPYRAYDLHEYFLPATQKFVVGLNPYHVEGFYNPPWLLIILAPLTLIPDAAQSVLFAVSLISLWWFCYKMHMGISNTAAFLLSLPVISILVYGNMEWLVLLGMLMPPQLGMFFVLIKPQVGIGAAIYWIIAAWKKGGVKEVSMLLFPVSFALLLSILFYGFWPLKMLSPLQSGVGGAFPWTIPLAFYILIKMKNVKQSLLIGPCISPHMMGSSWCGVFVMLSNVPWVMWGANVCMWMWTLLSFL